MGAFAVENETGHRLREIRSWRQLSLRAVADLSGISYSYLAKLERGDKPIKNRQVLEAVATALKVAPSEIDGSTLPPDRSGEQRCAGFT